MKAQNKAIRLILLVLIGIMIISVLSSVVYANENIPYDSYTYWEGYENKTPVKTKSVFYADRYIKGDDYNIGDFKDVQQVFSDGTNLFIVDSGNNRIVVLNNKFEFVNIIEKLRYKGEELSLSGVQGVFSIDKEVFIADTENHRILCCKNDEVYKIIQKPKSSAIPDSFVFAPKRIIKDTNGYLYVLCDGSYYGMMVFSSDFEFCGFFGANNVTTTVFGAIKNLITSIFQTEEKHNSSLQLLPYQIADICLDYQNHICSVNSEEEGQIRRYGTNGSNVLVHNSQFQSSNADGFNFADFPLGYVDTTSKYSTYIQESFSSICADNDGYLYAVDVSIGKIFMYDMNCKLISVFGGGVGKGNQLGTFITANSIAFLGDSLLVSDFVSGNITVFKLTDYGKTVKIANTLSTEGKDIDAEPYWQQIYNQDKNCQLAYKGLAKASFQKGDYSSAMRFAKSGLDRTTYSQAYKVVRNNFISKNFLLITLLVVLVISAIVYLIIISKKRNVFVIKNVYISNLFKTLSNPIQSFKNIKDYEQGSILVSIIVLVVFYITSIMKKLNGGFMYVIVNKNDFNAIYVFIGSVGVVLLWIVMNWTVCMLSDGKGTLKKVFCSSCNCLLPIIIENIIFLALSHFSIPTANNTFETLSLICTIWMIVLFLLSMTTIQDYSFFRSIGMAVVSIIGMLIGAFVIFIVLTLGQDLIGFVVGIVKEIVLR